MKPNCRIWKVNNKVYKNCFFGTEKTRSSTSTSTKTSTSSSTSTKTSTDTTKSASLSTFGLTAMWTFSNNLLEKLTGTGVLNSTSYSFVNDRIGTANAALYLNTGFLQVSNGIWFGGSLSIALWANMLKVSSYGRAVDFGTTSSGSDNIMLGMFLYTSFTPFFYTCITNACGYVSTPTVAFTLNTWFHIAATLSRTTGLIYINGALAANGSVYEPRSILRTQNYIGSAYQLGYTSVSAYYDDITFFNTTITAAQVVTVMNTVNV